MLWLTIHSQAITSLHAWDKRSQINDSMGKYRDPRLEP